jgi:hypothetical protein
MDDIRGGYRVLAYKKKKMYRSCMYIMCLPDVVTHTAKDEENENARAL